MESNEQEHLIIAMREKGAQAYYDGVWRHRDPCPGQPELSAAWHEGYDAAKATGNRKDA